MTEEEIRIENLRLNSRIMHLEYLIEQKDKIIEDYRKMIEDVINPKK